MARVEPGHPGHALFVERDGPWRGLARATCELEITAGRETIRRTLGGSVPKPARHPEPFGPDDVIYLIMIDRFADGDPKNNDPAIGNRMLDRRDTHAYHGGDFAGYRRRLPDLVALGVTAIWLTPVYPPGTHLVRGNIKGRPRKKWPTSTDIAKVNF